MQPYEVVMARSARKELERLEVRLAHRIIWHIEALAQQPRPSGCSKLQGSSDLWRIRVGDYRIVYCINEQARFVDVSVIRHRKDAYR
ncbi:MAG: type II toxin-antitoxin system RelE/ParE family toxin [Lentisphaerae bacterium]|nr:type II toxin-antitoxin system RelE/ParE family toxin [Lentisphaerota bacterium]